MRVGITGHQHLQDPVLWQWVGSEIKRELFIYHHPLVGITSLAVGADQLFAYLVLQSGGSLDIVVPFQGYEYKFAEGEARNKYYSLLDLAASREVLQKDGSEEQAYFEAGKRVVDNSDLLLAVWDGKPAAGLGGTADVVKYALACQKRVVHINPYTRLTIEYKQDDPEQKMEKCLININMNVGEFRNKTIKDITSGWITGRVGGAYIEFHFSDGSKALVSILATTELNRDEISLEPRSEEKIFND